MSAPVADARHPASLLDLDAWSREAVEGLFSTTDVMAEVLQRPIKKVPALQGMTVATLFFEASTRTRLSFDRAARALSADVMTFASGGSSLAKGESLADTVRTLAALQVDLFVVRHGAAGVAHQVERVAGTPVVNAGDGRRAHPTQALLDAYTFRAHGPDGFEGKRLTIVGDVLHSRVARSAARLWPKLGAEVVLCGPPPLLPEAMAAWSGVHVEPRLDAALEGADAVMALRMQHERMRGGAIASPAAYAQRYGLTEERLRAARPGALVMHPGPMNRDVEIEGTLADGPRSVITQQVAHGVPVRMAVLYTLLVGRGQR